MELVQPELRVSNRRRTDVMEITGFNSSYQAPVTVNYIYYDTYILFRGLE